LEGGDERRALARRMHLTSCVISIGGLVRRIICQIICDKMHHYMVP